MPMSRPAMTIPPSAARSRWRSRSARRSSGMRRDGRDGGVDRGAADVVGVVGAVDEDAGEPALRVGRQLDLVDEAAHRVRVRGGHVPGEREPGHRAIEQARVAEAVADLERGRRPDAALARRAGPVERDDEPRAAVDRASIDGRIPACVSRRRTRSTTRA